MNETHLTPRQKYVLNLVNRANGIDRGAVQEAAAKNYKISKPTVIRDLNFLLGKKLIRVEGKGKTTKYLSASINPLLKPFDLELYFSVEPDERTDVKNRFDFSVFSHLKDLITPEEIKRVEAVKKSLAEQAKKLNSDILKKEMERFVVELSWKSSKIEGNTYTLLETEALIKEAKEAAGKTKDEAVMILNHKKAFEQILKHQREFKKLSLPLISQLHQALIKDLGVTAGIRKQAVGITGTTYLPLDNEYQIREALEKLAACVNANPSPIEKALITNAMLSYIQPFADGNKRVGRMLANAVLMAYDYYPLSYRSVNEDEFKKALIIFYEQGSIYHQKVIFLEQLIFAYRTYFK